MLERSRSSKMYWCSASAVRDGDGFEWFVVATGARDARRLFAAELRCKEDDVSSLLVFILGDVDVPEGWPSPRVLESRGVRFIEMRFGTKLVEFNGKIYRAADVDGIDAAPREATADDVAFPVH
jgi:hypothetical protein